MRRRPGSAQALALSVLLSLCGATVSAQTSEPTIEAFMNAANSSRREAARAQQEISAAWREGYASMLVDLLDIVERTQPVNPRAFMSPRRFVEFVEERTGQAFGEDLEAWHEWAWSLPYAPHSRYGEFKGQLYGRLDARFALFFRSDATPRIRLDEIQWGGVSVNGIPPLDHPRHVAADAATYLDDRDVVFGFFLDGEARAYPRRILAWHELALDRIAEHELAIVYCTLCGTVIPFDARVGGRVLSFGTSGLLYRSNKLMFDHETASLWSSLTGEPVVGPLVELDLRLDAFPVVTTRWGEWRALHPDTLVLSVDTGYQRDYAEGAAYRDYFATDELMFGVSQRDARLPNKAEVLIVRSTTPADALGSVRSTPPFAIAVDLLREQPVLQQVVGGTEVVVVTSPAGANRVYATQGRRFTELDNDGRLLDTDGRAWSVGEDSLDATFASDLSLPRLPAHRSFWFGWYAQHPDTVLID